MKTAALHISPNTQEATEDHEDEEEEEEEEEEETVSMSEGCFSWQSSPVVDECV